jgi:Mrp family chromosome partitioning ATPase
MFGVLVVFLMGLRDRRFKNTEDVGSGLSRVRLLGLMPALPADLSDPQGREVAAHSVHQIRTLLQIGSVRDRGNSICITGPGVGTGKTTLALALGLSFGNSGSRTLLVDADLTGKGLTRSVGRMLLAHLRRIADGPASQVTPDAASGGACDRLQTLDPFGHVTVAREGSTPDDVVGVLARVVERLGVAAASSAGFVTQTFAVADLLFAGEVRAEVNARLEQVVGAAAAKAGVPAPRPLRPVELRSDHAEFNGDPIERYLYPTGTDALRFLPLRGLGSGAVISPAAVARILDRVQREFDVALIDTGPVLGAVETPMVAANSDKVLLVVSPGDDRSDAERAVAHMEAVGAKMAGVVFNRAGTKDVIRASRSRPSAAAEDDAP